MPTDLYATLGIKSSNRPGVKPETIKKAYRKRSMATHPDRGGDRSEFEAVKLAYSVLSDPERRKRYDETGEYDEGAPKQMDAASMILVQCLAQILAEIVNAQSGMFTADPTGMDIKAKMRSRLSDTIIKCRADRAKIEGTLKKLAKITGRFSTDEPENLLESVVVAEVNKWQGSLEKCIEAAANFQVALDMLDKFKYKVDPADKMATTYGFSSAASEGIWRKIEMRQV